MYFSFFNIFLFYNALIIYRSVQPPQKVSMCLGCLPGTQLSWPPQLVLSCFRQQDLGKSWTGIYNILRHMSLAPFEMLYKTLHEQPITPISQSATPSIAIGDVNKYMQVFKESNVFLRGTSFPQ